MSEVKTEKLSPRVASLQFGDSGDTFTVPSGATLNVAGTIDASSGTATGFGSSAVCTAYMTANQSFTKNVLAKVDFDATSFDTRSWYDTTNKRYTPQEAGYYWCQAYLVKYSMETQVNNAYVSIYKNGSNVQTNLVYGDWPWYTTQMPFEVSMPVYLNGSTDYVEVHFEWGANGTLGIYSGGSYGQGSKFHIFKMD